MKTNIHQKTVQLLIVFIFIFGLAGMPFASTAVRAAGAEVTKLLDINTITTRRASVDSVGAEAHGNSVNSAISADGRYVVFESTANDLVAGDTGQSDIFRHDMQTGATVLVSRPTGTTGKGDGNSQHPAISGDGRYIVFDSAATNLVSGDTDGFRDVFMRDMDTNTTTRISVTTSETQANSYSEFPSISNDGRYVAFQSAATNLAGVADTNGAVDIFVRDTLLTTTARVSISSGGSQANGTYSENASISGNGRFVVFASDASNLGGFDENARADIFVRDLTLNQTRLISQIPASYTSGDLQSNYASITADGRYIAFGSSASNLVTGDVNGTADVFLRDRDTDANGTFDETGKATTTLISVATDGSQGDAYSFFSSVSANGQYVAFESDATNLVTGDTNGFSDIFLRDRVAGSTIRLSVNSAGEQAAGELVNSNNPALSADGVFAVFESSAVNLVVNDTNGTTDVFVVPAIEEQVGFSRLDVSHAGTGSGSVTSAPAGIDCGTTCSHWYAETDTVVLSAAAATGSTFTGWSGEGCSGIGTCSVSMSNARAVTAAFALNAYTLTVQKNGNGTVTSNPPGINCGVTCAADYDFGTDVVLTAQPAPGWSFIGWSAASCPGTGTCTISVDTDLTVTATFKVRVFLPFIAK